MTLVAHISDMHFGSHDPAIAGALLDELNALQPAMVAISGDFTQRARVAQFAAAKAWLDRLTVPWLGVPGNHDIPLFDALRRFFSPRDRYREYIRRELEPCMVRGEIAMCGIDTTKTLTIEDGRVTRAQAHRVAQRLGPHDGWRIVVAHHPFVVPAESSKSAVSGAREALEIFEAAGIDLVLTGHLHVAHVGGRNEAHTMIGVQAGTCISTRLRGDPNGYNHLRFRGDDLTIVRRVWDGGRFVDGETKAYQRNAGDVRRAERLVKVGT